MIACASPRCCECAHPLHVFEPFVGGVPQHHRCPSCCVHLRVCRPSTSSWSVATVAEHAGVCTKPLPAVASSALRGQFFAACRGVARLLQPCEGVEPGMAALKDSEAA